MKVINPLVNTLPVILVALITSFQAQAAELEQSPGEHIYKTHCAVCHANPEATKAPAFDSLKQMTAVTLTAALTTGKMAAQGSALSDQERNDLVEFLATKSEGDAWIEAMRCDNPRKRINYKNVTVRGFGFDYKNTRHLSAKQAGLNTDDFKNLELAWSIAFPGVTSMRSQPAVVDNMLYLPVAENAKVYAFDVTQEPCLQWVYESENPLRSSAAFGTLKNGRPIIAVNDSRATVHVIDAKTGEAIWQKPLAQHRLSMGTGTPAIYNGNVYVPVSQVEIMVAAKDEHVCCSTHGMVAALDGTTGDILWEAHTMEDAKPIRDRGDGQMLYGPSGAPIWSSPLIDEKRGLLYVGTGEATSPPAHKHTDAILAIELATGKILWHFQATANDIYVAGCSRGGLNCVSKEETVYRDVDFGASMVLATTPEGKDLVIGGQKSGSVWALDADASLKAGKGQVVWHQQFGEGSPIGGVHWGLAFDGKQVYAPINRSYPRVPPKGAREESGLHAIDITTGKETWHYTATPNCDNGRAKRANNCTYSYGFTGAPTVIDSTVVTGSSGGELFAYDASSGEILFQFDAMRDYVTLNGISAKGGSFDNAGVVASGGALYVNSGYAAFGQTPGNVLMAFKPRSKM